MLSFLDSLKPWQSFYALVGTASATLVGLLFVAASVGSGYYTRERYHALRVFLSPTVVHFSSALAVCLVAVAPIQGWAWGSLLVAGIGLFGLMYAGIVWRGMVRHGLTTSIGLEDRIWYAALPAASYSVVEAGGIMMLSTHHGFGLLAAGLCMLLVVGIRNAWDMTLWTVTRPRE